MNDEDAWQAHFDEYPGDHQGRTVYADWLDDRDDPRAAGMRALGRLERVPWHWKTNEIGFFDDGYANEYLLRFLPASLSLALLPRTWLQQIPMVDYVSSRGYKTRREAENAAAIAWTRLTPEQQAEILSRVEVTA